MYMLVTVIDKMILSLLILDLVGVIYKYPHNVWEITRIDLLLNSIISIWLK